MGLPEIIEYYTYDDYMHRVAKIKVMIIEIYKKIHINIFFDKNDNINKL